ncbi:MAG: ATP-binding protein, partial [Microlunatus sp.]
RGQRRPAWVDVSLLSDGVDLVVHVIDSGDGVPPGREAEIFAGGWTTKDRDREAHGLGLALARTTARHHGGEVELSSARGDDCGATFRARMCGALRRAEVRR